MLAETSNATTTMQKSVVKHTSSSMSDGSYSDDDKSDCWIEPEMAPQAPSATGYPLGVPPPHKLLPKTKRNRKQYQNTSHTTFTEKDSIQHPKSSKDSFKPQIINGGHEKRRMSKTKNIGSSDIEAINAKPLQSFDDHSADFDKTHDILPSESDFHDHLDSDNHLDDPVSFSNYMEATESESKQNELADSPAFPISSPHRSSPFTASSLTFKDSYYQNDGPESEKSKSYDPIERSAEQISKTRAISGTPSRASSNTSFDSPALPAIPAEENVKNILGSKLQTRLTEGLTHSSFIRKSKHLVATGDLKVSSESKAESSSMTNIIAIDDEGPSHAHVESDSLEKASSTKETDASKKNEAESKESISQSSLADDTKSTKKENSNLLASSDPDSSVKRPSSDTTSIKTRKTRIKKRKTEQAQVLPSMNTRSRLHEVDEAAANDDFCSTCHGVGRFLCCEGCPKSFHFSCVDPPLDESSLPEGEWFCKECIARKKHPKPYKRGLFSQLLFYVDTHNPVQFSLPKKIKQRFEDVAYNEFGEYADNDIKVYKSTRSGFVEEDPYKLVDKQGNPIFCYKCKQSSLSGGPIARCEYCSLNWHLDCLNPPLPTVKTIGTKWKCPNHADHDFKTKRRPRSAKVIDTCLRRGFQNDGNIEIMISSDEESMEPRAQLFYNKNSHAEIPDLLPQTVLKPVIRKDEVLQIPEESVKLDFIDRVHEYNPEAYQDNKNADVLLALDELATRNQSEKEGVRNLCYLMADGTEDVLTATARNNIETLITAAIGVTYGTDSTQGSDNVIKNINDNGASHVKIPDSKDPGTNLKTQVPSHLVSNQALQHSTIKEEDVSMTPKRHSVDSEAGSTTGGNIELSKSRLGTETVSAKSSTLSNSDLSSAESHISPDERTHLLAIQRLLRLKGKQALLDFLLP